MQALDARKEFFNKSFEVLKKKHCINHFATASNLKASGIERFNHTLKLECGFILQLKQQVLRRCLTSLG